MGQLLEDLGNRTDGQLIRSDDWNQLVSAVDKLETLLVDRVTSLEQKVAELDEGQAALSGRLDNALQRLDQTHERLNTLGETVEDLQADVAVWTGEYFKMTLNTTRLNYPIGEAATLEARVTDVRGEALDLSDANRRPWVDFVANWGLLQPAPGFVSRGGVGERSISVRVNRDGIAQINVRAEHGEGVSADEEQQVATALTARVPTLDKSLSRVIMETATPVEAFQSDAFQILRVEYDREAETGVRRYIDTAYLKYSPQIHRRIHINPRQGWRDHRTTVLAFVKADNDPTTADHCMATSSIDITFRDWVGPFVELDYLSNIDDQVGVIRDRLIAGVDPSLPVTIDRFKDHIKRFATGKGWLGRLRNLRAVNTVLDQFQVDNPPPHLSVVTQSLRDAVSLQQTLDSIQLTTADPTREVALDTFTNSQVRADQDTAVIRDQIVQIDKNVQDFGAEFEQIRQVRLDVLQFDVRDQLTQLRKEFELAENEIKDLNRSVVKLETTDLRDLKGRVGVLDSGFQILNNGFATINTTVTRLDEKSDSFQTNAADLVSRQQNLETQIKALEVLEINPGEVSTGINQIGSILNRINVLERNLR